MVSGSGGAWKIVRNNRLYGPTGRFVPPVCSHEFVIQNQGDIAACVAFLLLVASIIKSTEWWASKFVSLSYVVSVNNSSENAGILGSYYTWGPSDLLTIFFYSTIWILFHVLLQDNTVERLHRTLNLSRTKQTKLNESAQLSAFCIVSVLWSFGIVLKAGYLSSISTLWEEYPLPLSFGSKFFYIAQLAYWVHCVFEFYLQMMRKEDIWRHLKFIIPYTTYIGLAYIFGFTRLATLLLLLHYSAEGSFHAARLLHYCAISGFASILFTVWRILFIFARLGTITFSVLTLWYGLAQTSIDRIDVKARNFNTQPIRVFSLAGVFVMQAYIMWKFIKFHLRRARQRAAEVQEALRATNDLAAAAVAATGGGGRLLGTRQQPAPVNGNQQRQLPTQKPGKKKKGSNRGSDGRNGSAEQEGGSQSNSGSVRQRKTSIKTNQ